ncbi:MAG: recombination mediator RecR [Lachnospiraceae bacterium]|nr:recombination mediator RecR [Lachnospiraceae bacterium]
MSAELLPAVEELVNRFRRLPGIGKKTAIRLAYAVLDGSDADAKAFSDAILGAKAKISHCKVCGNLSEGELCPVCSDPKRDFSTVCVVEDCRAIGSMEKVREFRGVYHVLGGTISPLDGRTPEMLNIASLTERAASGTVSEVILATNPTVEGEMTALYIAKQLRPLGIRVTRLAYGIPVGGDLEFADEMTLFRAMDGRKEIEE